MAGGIPQNLLANLSIRLGMDTKAFDLGTKQASKNLSGFGRSLGGIKTLMGAAFGAAAVAKLVQFGKASIEAYNQQIQAETMLLTALKGRSDITERLSRQASYLQSRTLFADEQTIEAQARLATILGTNELAIRKLIPLIQDFATVKKMGLVEAADLVAKSIGSGTNALRRYAIEIEGTAGSEKRLQSAIDALTKQVGGQAAAIADVGTASWEKMKNTWGEVAEMLGKVLTPSLSKTGTALQGILEMMTDDDLKWWQKLGSLLNPAATAMSLMEINTNKAIEQFEDEKKAVEESNKTSLIQIPLMQKINDLIEDQTELWKGSVTKGELSSRMIRLEQLKEEKKLLESLGTKEYLDKQTLEKLKKQTGGLELLEPKTILLNQPGEPPGLEPTLKGETFVDKWAVSAENLERINDEISQSFADLAVDMTDAFFEMATSGEGFQPGNLLLPIANVAENLGKLAISTGIATIAIKKSLTTLQGIGAIAAGIALVALAKMVKAKAAAMAGGGAVSPNLPTVQPASNTDRESTRYFGEPIKQKLDINVTVEGEIKGEDIRLSNKRAEFKHTMQS